LVLKFNEIFDTMEPYKEEEWVEKEQDE
jgi:hypothetical protein